MPAFNTEKSHQNQSHTIFFPSQHQDQSMSKRLALSPLLPAFFCVVTCNGMSSRTVAKKPQKQAEADERAAFGESFEFPITNDDFWPKFWKGVWILKEIIA